MVDTALKSAREAKIAASGQTPTATVESLTAALKILEMQRITLDGLLVHSANYKA